MWAHVNLRAQFFITLINDKLTIKQIDYTRFKRLAGYKTHLEFFKVSLNGSFFNRSAIYTQN